MTLLDYKILLSFQKRIYSDCAGIWIRVHEYTYGECRDSLKTLLKKGYIETYKKNYYKSIRFPPYWWTFKITEKGKKVEIKFTDRMWLWCEHTIKGCRTLSMSDEDICSDFIVLVDKF